MINIETMTAGIPVAELETIIRELRYQVFDLAGNKTTPSKLNEYFLNSVQD
jgi:hypothetical protein